MDRYFSGWCHEVGVSLDDLMTLGHRGEPPEERFNMAVMGFRLAGRSPDALEVQLTQGPSRPTR